MFDRQWPKLYINTKTFVAKNPLLRGKVSCVSPLASAADSASAGFVNGWIAEMVLHRVYFNYVLCLVATCCANSFSVAGAADVGAGEPIRFESGIRPILDQRCSECHSAAVAESGLIVSTRDRLLQGGDAGPALVRGSADVSLLYKKIAAGEMPPDDPLSPEEISRIRAWIDGGALVEGESASSAALPTTDPFLESELLVKVFFAHCISCHGKWKQEGGLDLRTRQAMLKGGKSGPALVPGDPEGSLVYRRLLADEMPPKMSVLGDDNYVRRVSPDAIQLLKKWISAGAPSASQRPIDADPATGSMPGSWAFRPLRRVEPPRVKQAAQVRTPIDAFILAKLNEVGLELAPDASELTLLRRAYYDLLGLPPSPDEVVSYADDARPDKYERLIDRLLASPRYGERWGQYWLDGAGYADSHGKIDRDQFRPYMWRYRDYVIRSFNADKPYDQFICEQLAGDELVAEAGDAMPIDKQVESLIATGFMLTAADATDEAAFNFVPNRMGVVAEQLEIISTSIMATTLECARCHNHKFDPITQRDYYRVSAIFRSALDPYDWRLVSQTLYPRRLPLDRFYQRYVYHPGDVEPPELARVNQPLRDKIVALEHRLEARATELRAKLVSTTSIGDSATVATAENDRPSLGSLDGSSGVASKTLSSASSTSAMITIDQLAERDPDFKKERDAVRGELAAIRGQLIEPGVIHGVRDMGGEPTPVFQLRRGEAESPAYQVTPGVPLSLEKSTEPFAPAAFWAAANTSGNRLGFARWLTQSGHPLTSRVIVNRLWQHHFGEGLVATPGNFGNKGLPPTHPELLDWMATELVEQRWSLKAMHRLIMTSAVYRQSSAFDDRRLALDPDNARYSRFPLRRLDGEALRDAMLAASGRLDLTPFGPPDGVVRTPLGEVVPAQSNGSQRRSLYLAKLRLRPLTLLEQFDGAEMVPNCLRRTSSTVPTQALELQNGEFARECAVALAERVATEAGQSDEAQMRQIFLLAFGRCPTDEEQQSSRAAIQQLQAAWTRELAANTDRNQDPKQLAWQSFCTVVLNSPEFVYID